VPRFAGGDEHADEPRDGMAFSGAGHTVVALAGELVEAEVVVDPDAVKFAVVAGMGWSGSGPGGSGPG
jgi:hypothetical protein